MDEPVPVGPADPEAGGVLVRAERYVLVQERRKVPAAGQGRGLLRMHLREPDLAAEVYRQASLHEMPDGRRRHPRPHGRHRHPQASVSRSAVSPASTRHRSAERTV